VNARPETSPLLLVALHYEGGVDVALGRGAAEDLPRVVDWLNADELRRRIVLDALALQRRAGVSADDAQLASLAAALERVPAETAPDSLADALEAVAPMGSFHNTTLRRILRAGEPGRAWLRWALARDWPQDPAFAEALRVVCEREGLTPKDDRDDEAGTT
jgi:hypothetical protein